MTSRIDELKWRMRCRNIAMVTSYFDEEGEVPWDYVERTGDGRFEAIVTELRQREGDCEIAEPVSLGIFDNQDDAVRVLREHDRAFWAQFDGFELKNPFEA